jgi:hypothetical protein
MCFWWQIMMSRIRVGAKHIQFWCVYCVIELQCVYFLMESCFVREILGNFIFDCEIKTQLSNYKIYQNHLYTYFPSCIKFSVKAVANISFWFTFHVSLIDVYFEPFRMKISKISFFYRSILQLLHMIFNYHCIAISKSPHPWSNVGN